MGTHNFGKAERLHSKKLIQELFTKGSSFYLHPFKVLTLPQSAPPNQVLISVSKRNFKKAVDRNLIKRRVRESYRLQKELIQTNTPVIIGILYTAKTILSQSEIQNGMIAALKKVGKTPTQDQNATRH